MPKPNDDSANDNQPDILVDDLIHNTTFVDDDLIHNTGA